MHLIFLHNSSVNLRTVHNSNNEEYNAIQSYEMKSDSIYLVLRVDVFSPSSSSFLSLSPSSSSLFSSSSSFFWYGKGEWFEYGNDKQEQWHKDLIPGLVSEICGN